MKNIVVGNLKMNLVSPSERDKYLELLKKEIKGKKFKNTELVSCPPFVYIEDFQKALGKRIVVGGQDCSWQEKGSLTGEISSLMLKNLGCQYVILGHSERRNNLGETDAMINKKMLMALKIGLQPILCVGENKGQEAALVIKEQLENCLLNVSRAKIEKVVVCYEPVWAISANNPDHLPIANEIMSARLLIKKYLSEMYGVKAAERVKIIYGGSVAPSNVQETCISPVMDGALVGKESLTPHSFVKIGQIIDSSH